MRSRTKQAIKNKIRHRSCFQTRFGARRAGLYEIYDITSSMDSFQAVKHFYVKRKLQLLSIAIDGCIEKQETPREGRKRYEKIG